MPAASAEIARILDQLEREYGGDPWHGTALRQILAGIDYRQAAAYPLDGAHSIWEIVLHMTAWKNEVRRRLGGAPAGLPTEGDWPAPPTPGPQTWSEAIDALDTAHRALTAVIARLADDQLLALTNDPRVDELGAGRTNYQLLQGVIQHDVYHSGQIALLKKAPVH